MLLYPQDKEGRTVDLSDGLTVTPVHEANLGLGGFCLSGKSLPGP